MHIPSNILFNISFGLKIVFSHIFGVSLFHIHVVAVYSLPTSSIIHRANNASSKPCFDCIRYIIFNRNNINVFRCLPTICTYQESNRYVVILIDLVWDFFKMSPLFYSYLLVSIFSICILKFKPILRTISAAGYFHSTNHWQIIGNFTIESFDGYWCSFFSCQTFLRGFHMWHNILLMDSESCISKKKLWKSDKIIYTQGDL